VVAAASAEFTAKYGLAMGDTLNKALPRRLEQMSAMEPGVLMSLRACDLELTDRVVMGWLQPAFGESSEPEYYKQTDMSDRQVSRFSSFFWERVFLDYCKITLQVSGAQCDKQQHRGVKMSGNLARSCISLVE